MRSMIRYVCLLFTITVLAGITHAGEILDAVRARDTVRCGVSTGLAGFAIADSTGNWTGLDADFCRGLAAAVLGDPTKVAYVPVSNQQRFTALQSGEVDLLSRNTTWTLTRDASLGLMFAGVTFYDGQGFMVPGDLGVQSATELGRRRGVRSRRYHHRAQLGGLLPGQRHELQTRRLREPGGSQDRLL